MNTTHGLTCKRLAAGFYSCEGFHIERITNDYYGTAWMLTWPGVMAPDASFDTKAEAVAQIAIELGLTF